MIHLIAKPLKGRKAKLFDRLKERLESAGCAYQFHLTSRQGEGTELARTYSETGNTLVVVGGDGMLNEVLFGMDPSLCPLGVIPAGTGNDFASSAKIPKGAEALELILGSEPKETDYIQFSDGRKSLNIAGLGIDVDILARCYRMKHLHAKSKYFLSLVASLCKYKGCEIEVHAGGETIKGNMLIAAICNGRQFGGGIEICPPADIGDHKLDLVFVDYPKRFQIPFALLKLMRGKVLKVKFAHHMQCEEAEFILNAPFTAQYDGELGNAEVFRAKLMRGLRVFRG